MHAERCVDGAAELAADCAKEQRPELLSPADPNPAQTTRSAAPRFPATARRNPSQADVTHQNDRSDPRDGKTGNTVHDNDREI